MHRGSFIGSINFRYDHSDYRERIKAHREWVKRESSVMRLYEKHYATRAYGMKMSQVN